MFHIDYIFVYIITSLILLNYVQVCLGECLNLSLKLIIDHGHHSTKINHR